MWQSHVILINLENKFQVTFHHQQRYWSLMMWQRSRAKNKYEGNIRFDIVRSMGSACVYMNINLNQRIIDESLTNTLKFMHLTNSHCLLKPFDVENFSVWYCQIKKFLNCFKSVNIYWITAVQLIAFRCLFVFVSS